MIILNKATKLATIKEIGDSDIIIDYMDQEYIIPLTEKEKQSVYKLVTELGMFTVAFDISNNQLLLNNFSEQEEENLYDILIYGIGDESFE